MKKTGFALFFMFFSFCSQAEQSAHIKGADPIKRFFQSSCAWNLKEEFGLTLCGQPVHSLKGSSSHFFSGSYLNQQTLHWSQQDRFVLIPELSSLNDQTGNWDDRHPAQETPSSFSFYYYSPGMIQIYHAK
jgi:hypothetical protein